MTLVVDASVAIKWMFAEEHHAAARKLIYGTTDLLAPELIWAEVASALWKRQRRGELISEQLSALLHDMDDWPVETVAHAQLRRDALSMAQEIDHPPYDCFYLALAEQRDLKVATADRRLHEKVSRSFFTGLTLWITDVP